MATDPPDNELYETLRTRLDSLGAEVPPPERDAELKRLKALFRGREARFVEAFCIGCGRCVPRCPTEALSLKGKTLHYAPERCIGCGLCTPQCPTEALTLVSKGAYTASGCEGNHLESGFGEKT